VLIYYANPAAPPFLASTVPRILFFSSSHSLLDVTSGNDKYKYFYGDDGAIANAMRLAATKAAAAANVAAEWEKPEDL